MHDTPELKQDLTESNVIFIHSKLDDMRLSSPAFRVYSHLARRAGAGIGYPGIDSMALICCLATRTTVEAVRELEERKMIVVSRKPGERSSYTLTKPSHWKAWQTGQRHRAKRDNGCAKRDNATVLNGTTDRAKRDNVRISIEGNPIKVIQEEESTKEESGSVRQSFSLIDESDNNLNPVPIPPSLNINGFAQSWEEWRQYRKEAKLKPYTRMGERKQLTILSRIGPKRAEAAIEHSIANAYQGIFEPKNNGAAEKQDRMFLTE